MVCNTLNIGVSKIYTYIFLLCNNLKKSFTSYLQFSFFVAYLLNSQETLKTE